MAKFINDNIYPFLAVLGILLRPFGMLAAGLVAGIALRHGIELKMQEKFFVPLIFLGVIGLVYTVSANRWASQGSLAMVGLGLLGGYMFLWKSIHGAGGSK